ncbi:DUF3078 domain-containing protein [Algoriphagus halophilus]|uniref:DUF3078 domain-containing protein n=1 Tax=Algoriphagus halophilus TaxID=226505 RepID=UPI00358E0D6B
MNGRANYAKDKWTWDNTMDFAYGIVKNKDEDGRKSTDRIYLDSKVGYKINDKWNYFLRSTFYLSLPQVTILKKMIKL